MCSGINCEPGGCPVADGALSSGSDGSGMAIISTNILKEKKIKVEGATGAPPTDSTLEPSPSPSLLPKGEADTPPFSAAGSGVFAEGTSTWNEGR